MKRPELSMNDLAGVLFAVEGRPQLCPPSIVRKFERAYRAAEKERGAHWPRRTATFTLVPRFEITHYRRKART